MKDNFIVPNLNTYSSYSLLSSTVNFQNIIDFAIKNNIGYASVTDVNLYGAFEFYKLALKNKLKPIIGLDVNYKDFNFLVYAKNFDGFKSLIKISSFILTEKEFDIEILLDKNVFLVNKVGSNFNSKKTNIYSQDQTKENRIAINEVRLNDNNDLKTLKVIGAVKDNKTIDEIDLDDDKEELKHFITPKDFSKLFDDVAMSNLSKEIKEIDLVFDTKHDNLIEFKNTSNLSSKVYINKLCQEGLNEKILAGFIDQNKKDIYIKRMNYELDIIDNMGFNDYFLVIQDFIKEARNKKILVGPGRGSAAGSLVAYLLGITSIDSIKYDLVFERFLNPGRLSMPDIDIDIMDTRRQEIIDYIFEKYGYDHVAHISTFQRLKAKMAIRDVGRVLKIPLPTINKISKEFPNDLEDNFLDYVESNQILKLEKNNNPLLFEIANKIIGFPRQIGIHAAGIVLSKNKLVETIPIQLGVNKEIVTQYSMEYLEELGLIKMDLLGLTNLTTISNILTLINMRYKLEIDLYKINLEDQKVFSDISMGNTLGIFQLESPGMRSLIKQMKPKCIEDISLCSALFRPGPQQNIKSFIARRDKKEKVDYVDIKCKDILESTYGIIVYQEQVISLVQRIANFSASEADIFRRIISKKQGDELEGFKVKFYNQAKENGYSTKELDQIFNYIYTFANYGFNHSHSIAYSLIGYWLSYLKYYYPVEFMAILMTSFDGNQEKTRTYVKECDRLKIKVLPPSINNSLKTFRLSTNSIMFGFGSIKGIGDEKAKKIIEARENTDNKKFDSYTDAYRVLQDYKINQTIIDLLIYAGAFDSFGVSRRELILKLQEGDSQAAYWDVPESTKHSSVDVSKISLDEIRDKMVEILGIYFPDPNDKELIQPSKSEDPLVGKYNCISFKDVDDSVSQFTTLATIKSVRKTKTKTDKTMYFVSFIDFENNTFDAACFISALFDADTDYKGKRVVVDIKSGSRGRQIVSIKEWL